MKGIKITVTLLVLAFCKLPRPSAASPLRPEVNHSGDGYPERGETKTWLIIAMLSAVLIAILLALSGPTLALLWNQLVARFG